MKFLNLIQKMILFFILICVPLVIYFRVSDPNIFKELLFDSLILAWTVVFCIKHLRSKHVTFSPTNLAFGAMLFLLMAAGSLLISDYKPAGFHSLEQMVCFIFFFFLVSQVSHDRKAAMVATEVVALGALVVSIYGVMQFFGIDFFSQNKLTRVSATFGHPNFLASYLVCTIPLTTGLLFSVRKNSRKYYYGLSLVSQSTCLMMTLTRAAIASVIVALIFFTIFYFMHKRGSERHGFTKKRFAMAFIIVCVGTGILLSIAWKVPKSEITRLTELSARSNENTIWLRWLEWKGTLETIKKAPFFGNGIGTFSIFFPPNQPPEFSTISTERDEFLRHAHSEYLELWTEMGIFGPAIFFFILATAIVSGLRLSRAKHEDGTSFWLLGLVAGLFGLGFHMFFSVSFRFMVTPLIFWFYLGVINGIWETEFGKRKTWNDGRAKGLSVFFFIIVLAFLSLSLINTIYAFKSAKEYYKSLVEWNKGKHKEALQHMERAYHTNRTKPEILYKKGALEVHLGKWSDALQTYHILEKIHPNFFHTNYNLSLCLVNMGNMGEAIAYGKKQIKLYPDFPEQYFLLGKAHYSVKNLQKAEIYFEQYLEMTSQDARATSYLGNIYALRSNWNHAIENYEQVLAAQPENLYVRLNLSQILMETDNLEKSCRNLSIILTKEGKSPFFEANKKTIEATVEKIMNRLDNKKPYELCSSVIQYFEKTSKQKELQVSIELRKGWNLFSIPLKQDEKEIAKFLKPIENKYTMVWAFDNGVWRVYDPSNPQFSDLVNMRTGAGYWIGMTDSTTLKITGPNFSDPIVLKKGWNLIGWNASSARPIIDALHSIKDKYSSVWTYTGGGWLVFDPANPGLSELKDMAKGNAYWIETTKDCTLTLP